jgi:hypothetical protein
MVILLEALVQAVSGGKTTARSGRVTHAVVILAPFLILAVAYFVSR